MRNQMSLAFLFVFLAFEVVSFSVRAQAGREYPLENVDILEKLSASPSIIASDRGCPDSLGAPRQLPGGFLEGKLDRPSLDEVLIADPYLRTIAFGRAREGDFDPEVSYEGARKRSPDTVKSSASLRYAGLGKRSLKLKF